MGVTYHHGQTARRILSLAVFPLLFAACATEPDMVGFPLREAESEREEADLVMRDVRQIEVAIEESELSTRVGARPLSQDELKQGMKAILVAQLS